MEETITYESPYQEVCANYKPKMLKLARNIIRERNTARNITSQIFTLFKDFWTENTTDDETREWLITQIYKTSLDEYEKLITESSSTSGLINPDEQNRYNILHDIFTLNTKYRDAMVYIILLRYTQFDSCELLHIDRSLFRVHLYRGNEIIGNKHGNDFAKIIQKTT